MTSLQVDAEFFFTLNEHGSWFYDQIGKCRGLVDLSELKNSEIFGSLYNEHSVTSQN